MNGIFLIIAIPFLFFYAIWYTVCQVRSEKSFTPRLILLSFITFNIVYITVIGNMLEMGENYRFRLMIDPYYFLFFALLLQSFVPALKQPKKNRGKDSK